MAHDKLRVQLEERLDSLRTRLSSIKQDVTQAHSSDSEEQAQERENDEVVGGCHRKRDRALDPFDPGGTGAYRGRYLRELRGLWGAYWRGPAECAAGGDSLCRLRHLAGDCPCRLAVRWARCSDQV